MIKKWYDKIKKKKKPTGGEAGDLNQLVDNNSDDMMNK